MVMAELMKKVFLGLCYLTWHGMGFAVTRVLMTATAVAVAVFIMWH